MSGTLAALRTRLVPRRAAWPWLVLGTFVALSLMKDAAGAPDLLSAGTTGASLRFTAPILLAGMGALWSERSGVVNIGLEGAMITGTWFGAWAGFTFGPEAGVVAGLVAGVSFGLLLAVLAVGFGVDQAVAGLALNLLAVGVTRFLSSVFFAGNGLGTITQSPQVPPLPTVSIPGVALLLDPLRGAHVPVLSDAAAVALGLTTNVNVLTILAFATVPVTAWILFHTRLGLRIRFAGEAPGASDSMGVSPNLHRYLAVAVSGALGALGGVYLVIVGAGIYTEGQVAGRGFIGMATVIFGNWMPGATALGAYLFGFTDALRTRQESTINVLLVAAGVLFLVLALARIRNRRDRPDRRDRTTAAYAGLAVGCLGWFIAVGVVPTELIAVAPQVATLLVLTLARQHLRPPAAAGVPYRRSEQT